MHMSMYVGIFLFYCIFSSKQLFLKSKEIIGKGLLFKRLGVLPSTVATIMRIIHACKVHQLK